MIKGCLGKGRANQHELLFTFAFVALFGYFCFGLSKEGTASVDGTSCWASSTDDAVTTTEKISDDQINVGKLFGIWFLLGLIMCGISLVKTTLWYAANNLKQHENAVLEYIYFFLGVSNYLLFTTIIAWGPFIRWDKAGRACSGQKLIIAGNFMGSFLGSIYGIPVGIIACTLLYCLFSMFCCKSS